jgi:solute:Na+ symporter, SSS family
MDLEISPDLRFLLGATIVGYVIVMYGLAFAVQGRIKGAEDFLVAGRRLPLSLAWATLLATWFGAGTLLAATDEIRREGLNRAALEPLGAGSCLIIAGLFFARPLWEMGLLTLSDFYRRRFGPRAELVSAFIMVPTYFGWVAAQFVALAGILELFFGIRLEIGILLVALVGMGYTLLGGMWSVTLTDAVQISLVLVGLVYLGLVALGGLAGGDPWLGLQRLARETPPEMLRLIPTDSARALIGWISIFLVGALGNIPGQDLTQRVFASRSASVARRACILAGCAYIGFGMIPVTLGLVANLVMPDSVDRAVLPALAHLFLTPTGAVVFTVAVISAVLSTIDSAILSPASVLAQNVFERVNRGRIGGLTLNRLAVGVVTAASLGMAYMGESAYSLLEDAYELPLVGLFVPLTLGLYGTPRGERPALAAMLVGGSLWFLHYFAGWEHFLGPLADRFDVLIPVSLGGTACSLIAYLVANRGGPPPASAASAA